MIETEY